MKTEQIVTDIIQGNNANIRKLESTYSTKDESLIHAPINMNEPQKHYA